MLIETQLLKESCNKILNAIDTSGSSNLTDLVELKTENNSLYLNVTNTEYYVSAIFPINTDEKFHATVNADKFLKLIPQLTTEVVEITFKDNYVAIKANGRYKIPVIFSGDEMMSLPKIEINNKTCEMVIDSEVLKSISYYNVKELQKGVIINPDIQKLHYVDEKGAVTFTTGACVNNFTLEKPIKILLNNKIVKLFKLFDTETVGFALGHDALSDEIIQTKIQLRNNNIELTAILNCDDSLMRAIPVDKIRGRAEANYEHTVNISKNDLLQAINRLYIFTGDDKSKAKPAIFEFDPTNMDLIVWDDNRENSEVIKFTGVSGVDKTEIVLDLKDLKLTLDTCNEQYISLSFSNNGQAVVIKRLNIYNVLPLCDLN